MAQRYEVYIQRWQKRVIKVSFFIAYKHSHFDETEYVNIRYKFENQHFGAKISAHLVEIFVAFHLRKIWFRFINHSRIRMYILNHDTWCCCGHIGDTTTTKWIIQVSVKNGIHLSANSKQLALRTEHSGFQFIFKIYTTSQRSARNEVQLIQFNCYKNVLMK